MSKEFKELMLVDKKGLEELQKVLDDFGIYNTFNLIDTLKNIRFLEKQNTVYSKQVKALEIIKEKRVDVNDLLNFVSLEAYNEYVCACDDNDKRTLTQEEYDLLNEVLL